MPVVVVSVTADALFVINLQQGTQVSSIATLLLCYFASFIHASEPNDLNKLCILSHTGVTATSETSVVTFIGFHPAKTHLEGGSYYADKLLFSNYLAYCSTFDFEDACGQRGPIVYGLSKHRFKRA